LDAGDLLFPRLPASHSTRRRNQLTLKADLIIKAFNRGECDGVAVGDVDLGLGKGLFLKMSEEANFPFISSNLFDRKTNKPIFKPHVMRELNGLRIGIFALISEDIFDKGRDQGLKEFRIEDPHQAVKRMVGKLRYHADLIILLSHLGHQADRLLAQKTRGIDIIVGGHTATPLYNPPVVGETLILQSSAYGRNIGSVDIDFSKERASFANADMVKSLRETLADLGEKTRTLEAGGHGKRRPEILMSILGYKKTMEAKLKAYGEKNPFHNRIVRLHEGISSDPDVLALIEGYKRKLATLDRKRESNGCGSSPQT
jgi:2',3'-cyclic-nucleotide 2'-phosphodiesterase (5'-nucleotidase family)